MSLTETFAGTERYEVRCRLGAGGMGVVYHAWDNVKRMDVALKVLTAINAEGIYRLKSEFRALSDVNHRNLVGLYDLVSAGPLWFFTMELIEGRDFLTAVRAAETHGLSAEQDEISSEDTMACAEEATLDGGALQGLVDSASKGAKAVTLVRRRAADPQLLLEAMRQLVGGVRAIHRSGKLHRDIKPSNALIDGSGRVVLLDFGLVSDTSTRKRDSHQDNIISGTPAYMAPEQAMGRPMGPAADWYAVGVMLYEALTGQLPFHGSWFQLIESKRAGPRLRPHDLNPQAPESLSQLAMKLLAFDPEERPKEAEILAVLGGAAEEEAGLEMAVADEPAFLGRAAELAALHAAFGSSRPAASGHAAAPAVVHLIGAPGIGKSALLREFFAQLRETQPPPVLLQGRCHEREAVPYKALDSLIDALTRYLLQLKPGEAETFLPREISALAQVFPVLRRVPAVAQAAAVREGDQLDKRGVRRRAFAVLRQLLRRIGQFRPLVLLIDDMQWGDPDSVELLASLFEPPEVPQMLLILAYRDEDWANSPVLRGVRKLAPPHVPGLQSRDVALTGMSDADCRALAQAMIGEAEDEERMDLVAREAQGSPLFVIELVRYRDGRGAATPGSASSRQVSLDYVLGARVANLSPPAQKLLQVIAVAGRPIAQGLAVLAAELQREARAILLRLRSTHFVRTAGDDEGDSVETFHNRVRELVIRGLAPEALRAIHAAWARVLTEDARARGGEEDVDGLAFHWLGAGDEDQALRYGLAAARKAHAVHANHDAVRYFETALRLLAARKDPESLALRREVEEETAQAARQAGLYTRAAELLQGRLKRAESATERADMHGSLGRVYQEMGDSDRAIVELETALQLYGQPSPRSTAAMVMRTVAHFLLHQWHTAVSGRHRSAAEDPPKAIDPTLQRRADIMFALIRIYYFIDLLRVTWVGMYAVNAARRLPRDGDRALALSFYGVMLVGIGMNARSTRWCEEAVDLARRAVDPVAEGVAVQRLGLAAMFRNDLAQGERLLKESIEIFKEVGEMWELDTSLMLAATSRLMLSDFPGAIPLYEEMGQTGRQINAIMHQAWALTWTPFCRYLLGEIAAEDVAPYHEQALELSARAKDLANTVATLQLMAVIAVREGQVEKAAVLAVRTHEAVSRYLVEVPFLQSAWLYAGEAALFALENSAISVGRAKLIKIVGRCFAKASRLSSHVPYLRGQALRIRARYVALVDGPQAAEPIFRRAIAVLEGTPNRWETATALYDASRAVPNQSQERLGQAIRIFTEVGAEAELRRIRRGMDDGKVAGDPKRSA